MSLGRNLSRARSHIIFIVGLLSAAAYILWVERHEESLRQRPPVAAAVAPQATFVPVAPAPVAGTVEAVPPPGGWRVQLGAFDTAAAAGRQWDLVRSRIRELQPLQVVLVEAGDLVRLQAGPLHDNAKVRLLCEVAEAAAVECVIVPPLTRAASPR